MKLSMTKYKGKSVAVLGLGIEGVDVVKYLAGEEAKITVLDQKDSSQLQFQLNQLQDLEFNRILGPSYLENLSRFDFIFRSPGIKATLRQLQAAEKAGVKITSSTQEFFHSCPSPVIGVTGTKGKGTTATLIHRVLTISKINSFLAGNIGVPMLELLPRLTPQSWVVLELSSFQLQDLDTSPHIAVITNIFSEHLDYHKDVHEYIAAKKNIINFQNPSDFIVANLDDSNSLDFVKKSHAKKFYFSLTAKTMGSYLDAHQIVLELSPDQPIDIGDIGDLKLPGPHNVANVLAAITASALAGADIESIRSGVFSFTGLEHRLELVRKKDGIYYYNDSFGTTPETAIAALRSFTQPVILIAGGSEKGSDYAQLGKEIVNRKVKAVILIGFMANRIQDAITRAGPFPGKMITGLSTMPQIIDSATRVAVSGDVVLLSPACASFDMFTNYKDRGNQFKTAVNNL